MWIACCTSYTSLSSSHLMCVFFFLYDIKYLNISDLFVSETGVIDNIVYQYECYHLSCRQLKSPADGSEWSYDSSSAIQIKHFLDYIDKTIAAPVKLFLFRWVVRVLIIMWMPINCYFSNSVSFKVTQKYFLMQRNVSKTGWKSLTVIVVVKMLWLIFIIALKVLN